MTSRVSETGQFIAPRPAERSLGETASQSTSIGETGTDENAWMTEGCTCDRRNRRKQAEKLQTLDLYSGWVYLLLSRFMKRWYGTAICNTIVIVLLGFESAENSFTFVGDLNIWSFVHKMYMFSLGLYCAHAIFDQLAMWSDCKKCDKLPTIGWREVFEATHTYRQIRSQEVNNQKCEEKILNSTFLWKLRVIFHQLPLPVLILFAIFHSITGTYFFYCLTGFVRQNNIKEDTWYTYAITRIDTLSTVVIFLWLRWALVFYNHEAKQLRNREQLWWKVFCIRWRYPVQCTLALSILQIGLTLIKLVDGVPFLKAEALHTSVTQSTWLFQVFLVTSVTFLSCLPHAVCQVSAIGLSVVGFSCLSATSAEIHAELYGVLYLFIPGAMAIAAMLYHTVFSPGLDEKLVWTKLLSQFLSVVFFATILTVLLSERRAFAKHVVYIAADMFD